MPDKIWEILIAILSLVGILVFIAIGVFVFIVSRIIIGLRDFAGTKTQYTINEVIDVLAKDEVEVSVEKGRIKDKKTKYWYYNHQETEKDATPALLVEFDRITAYVKVNEEQYERYEVGDQIRVQKEYVSYQIHSYSRYTLIE